MYTHIHWCTLTFTDVPSCLLMFPHVHSCSLKFTDVHSCPLLYTDAHSCSLMFTHVHSCLQMYIRLHSRTQNLHSCLPIIPILPLCHYCYACFVYNAYTSVNTKHLGILVLNHALCLCFHSIATFELYLQLVSILFDPYNMFRYFLHFQSLFFLNQVCAGHRPVRAWFLKIDPVRIVSMRACVHVCVRARGHQ